MMVKTVKIIRLKESDELAELAYWRNKTPQERLKALETLRKQFYGTASGLQRSVKIFRRTKG
ncbi:hypothetical protein SDC9_134789 [bioreactor metagenome]|uniref:Uncharacterized protein n=1 Tax=bioreactor metagenome TaxID=1076179 RepID=A0A645DEK8_9ZZZZ